jgi:hypothetical protein
MLSGGAAHREPINAQAWAAPPRPARSAPLCRRCPRRCRAHVVADHAHFFQALRAAAHNGGTLDWVQNFAVFNPIGFAGRKHKFARGDVHLTTAKVGGVQAFFDAFDDFLRVFVATQHVGIGHARHGDVGVAFASTIAGGGHTHQAGVHGVLDVALQNAVFNQHIAPLALPSSSTLSEPRRSAMVPSSSTVTPLAATRWPMRPLKALEPLRLKSPSSPWPMASCNKMPGQPGPRPRSFHRLAPGALPNWSVRHARPHPHTFQSACRQNRPAQNVRHHRMSPFHGALFARRSPSRDRRTSGRTSAARVPSARATITTSYSLAKPGHDLCHARVFGAGQTLHFAQQLTLPVLSRLAIGSVPRYRTARILLSFW